MPTIDIEHITIESEVVYLPSIEERYFIELVDCVCRISQLQE